MTTPRARADVELLENLVLGKLPVVEAERLAVEYADDSRVVELAEAVAGRGDTLVASLRNHQTIADPSADDLVRRLVLRLRGAAAPTDSANQTCAPEDGFTGQPLMPDRLEYFQIRKILGEGGMGTVYLADDTRLQRQVALKTLKRELAVSPGARERFLHEARSAARLEHDHIIPIYYVGESDGIPFLAMPLLQGQPLDARIQRGTPLPVLEAIRITRQIASGLAVAHERGLIHRDIKPGNVWLEAPAGRVKILDFGLVRSQKADTNLTASGAILGTPAYMAPEQARGAPVDHRADLFSLGCVLYEMLTGRRPFTGLDAMAVLLSVTIDTPKAPHEVNPYCPPDLSRLTMRLLAKSSDGRPASAGEVVDALAKMEHTADATAVSTPNPWADIDDRDHTEQFTTPAKPKAGAKTMPRKRRLLPLVAVGLMLAFVGVGVLFGGTIYRVVFNKGELVIEVEDKDIEVKIVHNGVVVQDKPSKREFTLTAGKGEIEVLERDGIKLTTKKFELTRNGRTTVKVTAGELAEARDAPERKAAAYVLSIGGTVKVNDSQQEIKVAADLPRGAFRLTWVNLYQNKQVSDAGLANFEDCKNLGYLNLQQTQVGNAGLAHFEHCKSLTYLNLVGTQVGDAGLVHFSGCKSLTFLKLSGTQVGDAGLAHFSGCKTLKDIDLGATHVSDAGLAHFKDCYLMALALARTEVGDAGLAHFKDCKSLMTLNLHFTKVSNAGLVHLKGCTNLHVLYLMGTQVSDTGLAHLEGCKKLTVLDLLQTKVTKAGAQKFAAALPGCKITSDHGTFGPNQPSDPDRKAAEWILSIGGVVGVNDPFQWIETVADLPRESFRLTGVVLLSNPRVSDANLVHLDGCKNLTYLYLRRTQVGDAGLAHFKGCKNLTYLDLTDTKVTDAGLAHFEDRKNLTHLIVSGTRVGDAGLAHFKDCKNLTSLEIQSTKVSDAGLAHFKGRKNLTYLNLGGTKVTDAGLAHFEDCKNLTHLNVADTRVGDAGVAHFEDCKSLTSLRLDGSQAGDAGLAHFKDCKSLSGLHLGGRKCSDAGLAHFKDCKSLKTLYLNHSSVSDASLEVLAGLPSLSSLEMRSIRISKHGYNRLKAAMPKCNIAWSETNRTAAEQVLALGGSVTIATPGKDDARPVKATDVLPLTFFQVRTVSLAGSEKPLGEPLGTLSLLHFAEFDRLESIDLSGTKTPDLAPLMTVAGLRELSLAGAGLTDESLGQFPKLPKLRRLVLDNNPIRGTGLARLQELPELRELSLGGPALTDLFAKNLAGLKKLKKLSLVGAPLTDAGVRHLTALTELTALDLRKTKVTAAGIVALKKALPKVEIEWDGGEAKGK